MTKLAVLADIHGNRWALDAVIADARDGGAQDFLDLGDCAAGPLDPRATLARLMDLGAATVRGNNDREMVSRRADLDAEQLAWLAALPATLELAGGVLACHGSPSDDTCYLLEEVREDGVHPREPHAVRELLGGVQAAIVLCGHTHIAREVMLEDGTHVINPGSVGCPAYSDDHPYPHAMQSGSPHARYALLSADTVEFRAVEYAWDEAAALARANGREDWARALLSGRVA